MQVICMFYVCSVCVPVQVKKLKAQVEQKNQRNGTEEGSSPEGEVLENGTDPHILDLQSEYILHSYLTSVPQTIITHCRFCATNFLVLTHTPTLFIYVFIYFMGVYNVC